MAQTIDPSAFAADAEALALKVRPEVHPGLLGRYLAVPGGSVAFVRDADGAEDLLRGPAEKSGDLHGVLAKEGEREVSFQVDALPTKDGIQATAGVGVVLRMPAKAIGLRAFEQALLAKDGDGRDRVTIADLRVYLLPAVRDGLALFVASRTADELYGQDPRPALWEGLKEQLKALTFEAGLDLLDVRHPSFYSEDFEARRERERRAKAEADELKAREQLESLQAQLERGKLLKKREVEELAQVLRAQGVLKELELKKEVDQKRKEEQLRRVEELAQKLGNDSTKALIFLLEDERAKAELIQQLIERDMTEGQLKAKRAGDVERRLEERIQELSAKLSTITKERQEKELRGGTRTRRIYGALGKQVHAFDPTTNVRRDAPKEVYDFAAGPLGYLRSVRTAVTARDGAIVIGGAQRGVYVTKEGDVEGNGRRELVFPREPAGQGGVNAAAYFDGHIYATHSEIGLFRWDLDGIGRGEPLFAHVTGGHDSTRGVTILPDGKLFFASGPDLFRSDLVRPEDQPTTFRGLDESITAFVVTREEVFGGTKAGRILRWSMSDPGSPREQTVRKSEPIFMLRIAEIGGAPHLVVGAKEHGLTAVSLEDGRAVDYRGKDQIRWVDGASDYVYGVSRGGYAIHVWEAGRLDAEAFVLRVSDRLQDLWVRKEALRAVPVA